MTDKTREDVVEAVARAINPDVWGLLDLFRGDRQRIDEFQRAELDMSIHAAKRVIAALNTRPDIEADMRERCARVAEQAYDFMQAQGSLSSDSEFVGACEVATEIATAIRSLPLSNKGESRG